MNIIFIDIDGPLLPGRAYILNYNHDERPLEEISCQFIKEIINRCDAKLVACTTHSRNKDALFKLLSSGGITKEMFHDDWKVMYPNNENISRQDAVKIWLSNHPDVENYVIIDDAPHADNNWIEVDREIGITINNYRKATKLLGNPDKFVVLI